MHEARHASAFRDLGTCWTRSWNPPGLQFEPSEPKFPSAHTTQLLRHRIRGGVTMGDGGVSEEDLDSFLAEVPVGKTTLQFEYFHTLPTHAHHP